MTGYTESVSYVQVDKIVSMEVEQLVMVCGHSVLVVIADVTG